MRRKHSTCSRVQSLTWQFACLLLLAVQFDNYPSPGKNRESCHLLHQEASCHFLSLFPSHLDFISSCTCLFLAGQSDSVSSFNCGVCLIKTALFNQLSFAPVYLVKGITHYPISVSLTAIPPRHPFTHPRPPPPLSPSVPLCSHGPCMWHEAEPKHPGCPLQPSTVPDLVKF